MDESQQSLQVSTSTRSDRNSERKFQFLSQVTKPDYSTIVVQEEDYSDVLKEETQKLNLHETNGQRPTHAPSIEVNEAESEKGGSFYFPSDAGDGAVRAGTIGREEDEEIAGLCSTESSQNPAGPLRHSPIKIRRVSRSPSASPSPFRQLQAEGVMLSVSEGSLLNGSAQQTVWIASSSDVSSTIADAVSLPSRSTSRFTVKLAPSEHSHVHAHLTKGHHIPPVDMLAGGTPKRTTRPGVITPGPIIPREQALRVKPFRITQSQPPTPRENAMSPAHGYMSKEDSEIHHLYAQQCRRVRELSDEMERKDERIAQLEQDLMELRNEMERLRCDATRYNDEIDSLRYEISWKDERIDYLEKELARYSKG